MNSNRLWKTYLLYFAQQHIDFRFAELSSLLSLYAKRMQFVEEPTPLQPYWIVEFENEDDVKLLASRSVSLRFCIELWAHANTVDELHSILKELPSSLYTNYLQPDKSFRISVKTFCKHFSQSEKVNKIQTFDYLPFEGSVNLKNPDTVLQYLEYYGVESNNPPSEPHRVFFGRWVAAGYRQIINCISLKTRKFIGNTSMDPQLSLLMANQAKVTSTSIVLDPFVGSGSLLVAAASFGAYVMGTDIDFLMLHGKTRPSRIRQQKRAEDEGIKANMEQYGLSNKYLDVLVSDFCTSYWKDSLQFDAIITDPPYGIREATEKVGIRKENYTISEKYLATHIPAKIGYEFSQIYKDLLIFAAKHLRVNGRLVCWFPILRKDYMQEGLPNHPSLKLIANSEQILSKYLSRRLLTYEKVTEFSDELGNNMIENFTNNYYKVRDVSRHERRTKQAAIREHNRIEALQRHNKQF